MSSRSTLKLLGPALSALLILGGWVFRTGEASSFELKAPLGLIEPEIPGDNPLTGEKVELGRKLYFDKRLSIDDSVSCATCHDPEKGFADGRKVALGIKDLKGTRNSPTVLNAALFEVQFWDGRAPTLEEQAKQPLINPVEMGMPSHEALVEKLKGIAEYREAFGKVFGGEIDINKVVMAVAAFERTLLSGNSPFDRFVYEQEKGALSPAAQRGLELFRGKARCVTCHEITDFFASFSDNKFHNVGVGVDKEVIELMRRAEKGEDLVKEGAVEAAKKAKLSELGRFIVTGKVSDLGAFKTPSLRDIALTAPYMHDGSEATLEDVVELYNRGGNPNPHLDGGIRPLNLTEEEKAALVEFMKSLTSSDLKALVEKVSP